MILNVSALTVGTVENSGLHSLCFVQPSPALKVPYYSHSQVETGSLSSDNMGPRKGRQKMWEFLIENIKKLT